MPTVEPQREALHFFRGMQALVFAVLGTALVVLTIPTLTTNFIWTTFAAIASIFTIVPAILAVRRAARNRPAEPTIHFRQLRMRWALLQIVFAIAVAVAAKFLTANSTAMRGHMIIVIAALYVVAAALVLRFMPFYIVAAAVLVAAIVPFHSMQISNSFGVASLATGLFFWLGAFLVFSRTTQ